MNLRLSRAKTEAPWRRAGEAGLSMQRVPEQRSHTTQRIAPAPYWSRDWAGAHRGRWVARAPRSV